MKSFLPREEIPGQFVNINVIHVVERLFRRRRKLFVDVVDYFFDGVDGGVAVNDCRQISKTVHFELVRQLAT